MSMIPFFPSLRPPIARFELTAPNEEEEACRYEREHNQWLDSIKNAASELNPLGKVLTLPGPETDDEDANDDSDDSDSHDDEDEDTNDREPERAVLGLYSPPGEDGNDDMAALIGPAQ